MRGRAAESVPLGRSTSSAEDVDHVMREWIIFLWYFGVILAGSFVLLRRYRRRPQVGLARRRRQHPTRPIPATVRGDGILIQTWRRPPGLQAAWRYYSLPNVLAAVSLAIAAATALAVPATTILLGEVQPRVPWLDCRHVVDAAWSRLVPWCTVALFVFLPFAQLHDEVSCPPRPTGRRRSGRGFVVTVTPARSALQYTPEPGVRYALARLTWSALEVGPPSPLPGSGARPGLGPDWAVLMAQVALLDVALIGTLACVNEILHLATPLGLIASALGARGVVHTPAPSTDGPAEAGACSATNGSCTATGAVLSLAPVGADSALSSAAALLASRWAGGAPTAWRALRSWLEAKLQFWLVLAATLGLLLPGLVLLLLTVPVRAPPPLLPFLAGA